MGDVGGNGILSEFAPRTLTSRADWSREVRALLTGGVAVGDVWGWDGRIGRLGDAPRR